MNINPFKKIFTESPEELKGVLSKSLTQYKSDPKNPELLKKIGETYLKLNIQPKALFYLHRSAIELVKQNKPKKARDIIDRIAGFKNTDPNFFLTKGQNLLLLEKPRDAMQAFLEAVRLFIEEEQFESCFKACEKVATIQPQNYKIRKKIADIFIQYGNSSDAIPHLNAVSKHAYKRGNFHYSIQAYNTLKEIQTVDKESDLRLGMSYYYNSEYKRSIDLFEGILTDYPENSNVMLFLASAYQKIEKKPEADRILEKVYQQIEDTTEKKYPYRDKSIIIPDRVLERFGTNITSSAISSDSCRIFGRSKELNQIIEILNRKKKNNPILTGPSGVGKTALVKGLALELLRDDIPSRLKKRNIISIDIMKMMEGAKWLGTFPENVNRIIESASKNNFILYFDEIHTIVGAGSSLDNRSGNLSNYIKPALSEGQITVIGSTTDDEYQKYIVPETALDRRFQRILIKELNSGQTEHVLKKIAPGLQEQYGLLIGEDAIKTSIELSQKYMVDRYFPDKAIDLIDQTCSRVKLSEKNKSPLGSISEKLDSYLKKISLKNLLHSNSANFNELLDRNSESRLRKKGKVIVSKEDIEETVAEMTGIPVTKTGSREKSQLKNLEIFLNKKIIGQDGAVSKIANAVRLNKSEISFEKNESPCIFLFLGPTGTGKTETAKLIAQHLYSDKSNFLYFDMTQYGHEDGFHKLFGSTYEDLNSHTNTGQLISEVKKNPYGVILLDEIEKAHWLVFQALLRIFDEGAYKDVKGSHVSFSNYIIIMTSNAGSGLKSGNLPGFRSGEQKVTEKDIFNALEDFFPREFINRISHLIVFQPISKSSIKKIIQNHIQDVVNKLQSENKKLIINSEVLSFIADEAYNPDYGARYIHRTVQELLLTPIANMSFEDNWSDIKIIKCHVVDEGLDFICE